MNESFSEIRVGVIGLNIGMDHAERALLMGGCRCVAAADPDVAYDEQARSRLGDHLIIYRDAAELICRDDIDVVFVCSPTQFHCEQTIAALNAGKDVFCEKPLGLTLEECDRMIQARNSSGRLLQVGLVYRYSPFYRKLVHLTESGVIGRPQNLWCHEFVDWKSEYHPAWRKSQDLSGGALTEKNCHHFDLFNWIAQSRAVRVMASGGRNKNSDWTIIDNAWVNVDYENGIHANLGLNLFCRYTGLPLGVIGLTGKLESFMDNPVLPRDDIISVYPYDSFDVHEYHVDYYREFEGFRLKVHPAHGTAFGHSGNVEEVRAFLHCVRTGKAPFASAEIGRESIVVPLMAERSIRERRVIEREDVDYAYKS